MLAPAPAGESAQIALQFAGGSWPQKAHGVNRLGFIQETVTEKSNGEPVDARYFGFMTSSAEKNFDQAKIWQKKVLAVDPKDPEAAYTIGVIDWTQAHENKLKALQEAGLNDDGKGNAKAPKKVMEPLAKTNAPLVDEGLKYLQLAVDNRPNYDDAMQYLNLIYRNKADVDYGDNAAVDKDLAMAQDWTNKAMGTRKANEEKKNAGPGGITMDSNGNLK